MSGDTKYEKPRKAFCVRDYNKGRIHTSGLQQPTPSGVAVGEAVADQYYQNNISLLAQQNKKRQMAGEQIAAAADIKTEAENTAGALQSSLSRNVESS